jgi:AmiR/NasT family two-component response regulator
VHQSASNGYQSDLLPRPASAGDHENLTTAQEKAVTDAVVAINAGRESIHYVCGILMLIYRVAPDEAFEVLKWRSQETNVKLRKIADQLLTDIRELEYDDRLPPRQTFDRLLMTVHERVSAD